MDASTSKRSFHWDVPLRARGADLVLAGRRRSADVAAQTPALERAGYQVRNRATPAEALTILREQAVGVMILDQTFRRRKPASAFTIPPGPSVTTCGHPGHGLFSDHATAARALRAGMRDYLEKTDKYVDELPRMVRARVPTVCGWTARWPNREPCSPPLSAPPATPSSPSNRWPDHPFSTRRRRNFQHLRRRGPGPSASRFLPELLSVNDGTPCICPQCAARPKPCAATEAPSPPTSPSPKRAPSATSFHTIIAAISRSEKN